MWSLESFAILTATFFLAGLVKGVVGLGLPTVSLALLTAAFGLKAAMALLVFPSLVTNALQAVTGGRLVSLLKRLWPLLVLACVGTWFGVKVLAVSRVDWLTLLFGLLLVGYALSGLFRPAVPDLRPHERWLSPLTGVVNGFLTGLTGSFVMPGVLYLQALRLERDALIQAMGILFTVSTAALGLALGGQALMDSERAWLSALAVVPAVAGMAAGLVVRRWLSEATFRKVMFLALIVLGIVISVRAALRLGDF